MMNRGVNEVPTPQQELEMGNPDIENQIDDQVMASTERNNIERQSIHIGNEDLSKHGSLLNRYEPNFDHNYNVFTYLSHLGKISNYDGSHMSRLIIHTIFYDWLADNVEKYWFHVQYMIRWLGLNIQEYCDKIEQQKHQILGHYGHFLFSECFIEACLFGSCFQVTAILLFQNIRNGIEILKGSNTEDYWSEDLSNLFEKLMEDQIETKIEMLTPKSQIPWLAVETIISCSNLKDLLKLDTNTSFHTLAMSCFDDIYPRANKSKVCSGKPPSGGFKHLLHIFHWTRTPEEKWLVDTRSEHAQPANRFSTFFIPNATQLLGSSITFKKHVGGSGLDVIYKEKKLLPSGLIQITPLHIFPYSQKIFRGLIEFEQMYLKCGLPVSAYLACMKRLLQNKEDVKLLQKNGIVQNTLKGEKDVLDFVQDIAACLLKMNAFVPDELSKLSEKVMEHHERDTSRCYADFKSQVCPSKWVIISIIGALALFVLTLIQTIYTTLGYYHQN